MKKIILTIFALFSVCATSADAASFDGSVSLGGTVTNIHGQKAKANEYRTLGSGVLGEVDLSYRDPGKYLDFDANLMMNDGKSTDSKDYATDNKVRLKSGMTDIFKFSLYYDEIPHNLTYGARTYFNNIGTNAIASTLTNPPAAALFNNVFEYSIKRTNYGAEAEVAFKTPFFFLVRIDRTETKGIQPLNISPWDGGTAVRELPAPVDYTTENLYLQTGYRSKALIATLDGTISNFTNTYNTMTIQQGAALNTTLYNTAYLPPENKYYKIGGSVMYRAPIWNTTLMLRGSHSILESNPLINEQTSIGALNGIPANTNTILSWNGLVKYNTAGASITSQPTRNLDTRFSYNFTERKNESDTINNVAYNGTGYNTPGKFGYHKQNAGIDLGYKLPAATKVSAGYEYSHTNRASFWTTMAVTSGNPEPLATTDNTLYVQAKNNLLDVISGKLRYEHQMRSSDFPTVASYLPTARAGYFREFESAKKEMDALKAEFEVEPLHGLSIGLQYALKLNKYTNSPLGVQDDTRHEFYADVTYEVGIAKVNIFGELEHVTTNATFYSGTYGSPATATSNFFWDNKRKDINFALGGKVDVEIIKNKLSGTVGYRYEQADGSSDFTTYNPILTTVVTNNAAIDDYYKHCINAKLSYSLSKSVIVDLGYLYEKLNYTDDFFTGYTYAVTTNALSGAYANPNYEASAVYTKLTYKF